MEYTDKDGTKKNPYIIHRTSIGCYERTLALLIEKYAGAFPTWLAPVQVKLLPIADRHIEYMEEIKRKLADAGVIRTELDDRSEKLGYKDIENGVISVRSRKGGDLGSMTVDEFIAKITEEINTKSR